MVSSRSHSFEVRRSWRALSRRVRDPVRLGIQAAAAAAATFGVMTMFEWRHLSWALISGLFVLHLNSDATRNSLVGRLSGTLLGSLIGLAAVGLMPGEDWAAWRVPTASFVAMIVAVFKPGRSYVLVAAVAVALETSDPAWVGALERVRAIATGSGMGLAASILIWPERAQARAVRALADALEHCRALASLLIPCAAFGKAEDSRTDMHDGYRRAMSVAHSRIGDCRGRQHHAIDKVRRQIDRVWHDLVFLDRLSRRHGGEHRTPTIDLSDFRDGVWEWLDGTRSELLEKPEGNRPRGLAASSRQVEHVAQPLQFVLEELQRDLAELRRAVRHMKGDHAPRAED